MMNRSCVGLENHCLDCLASDAGVPRRASGTMLGIFEIFFFVVIREEFPMGDVRRTGLGQGLAEKEQKRKAPWSLPARFPDFPIHFHKRAHQRPSVQASGHRAQGPGPLAQVVTVLEKNKISARKNAGKCPDVRPFQRQQRASQSSLVVG